MEKLGRGGMVRAVLVEGHVSVCVSALIDKVQSTGLFWEQVMLTY